MLGSKRLWLGLAVTLVFLGLLFFRVEPGEPVNISYRFDLEAMVRTLRDANYAFVAPGIALYFLAVVFRTIRWRFLLSHLKPIPVGRLFPVVVVGYMANNLLPVRLGEVVRGYYLGQREGVSKSAALATIGLERVFDGLTLLLLLAAAALVKDNLLQDLAEWSGAPVYLLVLGAVAPFVIVLTLMITAARWPGWPVRVLAPLARRLPRRVGPGLVELTRLFISGLASLRDLRRVQMLLLLSLPVWLLEASMLYVIGFSFDLQDYFSNPVEMAVVILAVTATANLATSVPSSQGGIGPFEVLAIGTLEVLSDVPTPVATAYTITMHAALLLPVVVAGLAVLWSQNVSFRDLSHMGKGRREVEQGIAAAEAAETERQPW